MHTRFVFSLSAIYLCEIVFCVSPGCDRAKADVVFLVDESSSVGFDNFNRIKDFIFRVVTYFPVIGPLGTQVSHRPLFCARLFFLGLYLRTIA